MSIAQVQKATATAAAASVSATLGAAPTAGNLLVAVVKANNANAVAIAGWLTGPEVAGSNHIILLYKVATGGESATVTAICTSATIMHLHVLEYSGLAPTAPLDQTSTGTSGGTGVTSLSTGMTLATTFADELAIAGVAEGGSNGDTVSWSNSFTAQGETDQLITADRILTAVGTVETTGSWATSRGARAVLATFHAPSARSFGAGTTAVGSPTTGERCFGTVV